MKKFIALSTAALMGSALIAAPALAQVNLGVGGSAGATVDGNGVGVDAGGGAGATVGTDSGVNLGANANADTNVDTDSTTAAIEGSFDGALAAVARSSENATSIGSMTEVSSVNVIKLGDMANANMEAFGSAETENQAGIDELRASLDANAAVKAALDAQSVTSDQVVAADVNADGSLTVYVR